MKKVLSTIENENKQTIHISRAISSLEGKVGQINKLSERVNKSLESLKMDEKYQEYPDFSWIAHDAEQLMYMCKLLKNNADKLNDEYEITF